MANTSLPPGFRFHPTDVELIMYYLKRKVTGKKFRIEAISELNIYKFSPWDLPEKSCLKSKDREWYFFCPRERKYASGARMNRATETGYWKTTGKDRPIHYNDKIVGMVKTLVFHQGHAPHGQRTDWVLHEYRIQDQQLGEAGVAQDAFVLCKLFHKSGPGPKNGAQYGAPFKEEEWDDDVSDCDTTLLSSGPSFATASASNLPGNPSSPAVTIMDGPGSTSTWSLTEPSSVPPVNVQLLDVPDDDISRWLSLFREDDVLPPDQINYDEILNNDSHESIIGGAVSDPNDIFNGLGELGSWQEPRGGGFSISAGQDSCYVFSPMQLQDSFLELNDLEIPLNSSMEDNGRENALLEKCRSDGDPENSYNGVSYFGVNQHYLGSTQFPPPPDGSNGGGGVSSIRQVNSDGSNANNPNSCI